MTRPREYQRGESVPGTVYRVVRLIGAGGMGTVYDVEDTTVGKRYVLKTLHAELHNRKDLAQRMVKEARQLARLGHPNIVEVVTAGVTADDLALPYYVMEKLNGQSLHTVLTKKGRLELPHALHIAIDLLDALDNAHDKGVVHRDVKPDNIFLHISSTGTTTTKLLDFGIMRVLDEPGVTAGRFMGTLRYAAPEQLRGETPMPQTDLYAAALVLFEMVAGRGPFDDKGDSTKIAGAHLSVIPPPMGTWGASVPEPLERLVRMALSKDPAKRPKDAFTFASQLRNMNRALAAERALGSATSRPTAVPILAPEASPPSSPRLETRPAAVTRGETGAAEFAPTEHADTRPGTPEAKAPATPTSLREPAPSTRAGGTEPLTERAPPPVDREAGTRSAVEAPGPARVDGSTERLLIVPAPAPPAAGPLPPSTLRMTPVPMKSPGEDSTADGILARLPSREALPASTDGAASATVAPSAPGNPRPVVGVVVGVGLTAVMVGVLVIAGLGLRGRLGAEASPASATEPAPPPTSTASAVVPAPTLRPPLDLPSAATAADPAPTEAATAPGPGASASSAPGARRQTPARVAASATGSVPAPPPAAARKRLPASGL